MSRYLRFHLALAAWFALLAGASASAAAEGLEESLRGPAFGPALQALQTANAARASVLAPVTYSKAAEAYQRAEREFSEGGRLERISGLLEQAKSGFDTARGLAETAAVALAPAYQARLDAESSDAATHAARSWRDAEVAFYEAASALEEGNERRAERYGESAEAAYRAAELEAIETALLEATARAIEQADKAGARRKAPSSYQHAVDLLAEARAALAADRYDTDRPRNLATQSLHHAAHALYVSGVVDRIQKRDSSVEAELLAWEAELGRIADLLDLAVFYDTGPREAVDRLAAAVRALQQERDDLRTRLEDSTAQIGLLKSELGGQNTARERLNRQLEQQQRRAERLRIVEGLFDEEEAQVLRVEDRVVIRLIGLNFASGSAAIHPDQHALLGTLISALAQFPESPLIIEGHTDSFGADDMNQRLSTERADAVADYLHANSAVSPALVTAIGYGETKPVANNETAEGRAKNRRIDVVIYPTW